MQHKSDRGPQSGRAFSRAWPQARRWFLLAFIIYVVMLVGSLLPMDRMGYVNVVPLIIHVQGIIAWLRGQEAPWAIEDMALNLGFFVPATVALARGWQRLHGPRGFVLPVCVLGCAGSVVIELCQAFVPSRIATIDDVLFNAVGIVLTALFMHRQARHQPVHEVV